MNAHRSPLDEREIRQLVSRGNDELVVRLIYQLVGMGAENTVERVDVLTKLATRYFVIAARAEVGSNTLSQEECVKWVERLLLTPPSENHAVRSSRTQRISDWYEEALRYYTLVLQLRPSMAVYESRALVRAIVGEVGEAIVDLTMAIRFAPYAEKVAHLYYLRGLVFISLGDDESGVVNLSWAAQRDPRYQEALSRFGRTDA